MTYAAALFCQQFAQELRRPGLTPHQRITAVIRRISPSLRGRRLRIYIDSLHATMTVDGALRRDWQQKVLEEHGS